MFCDAGGFILVRRLAELMLFDMEQQEEYSLARRPRRRRRTTAATGGLVESGALADRDVVKKLSAEGSRARCSRQYAQDRRVCDVRDPAAVERPPGRSVGTFADESIGRTDAERARDIELLLLPPQPPSEDGAAADEGSERGAVCASASTAPLLFILREILLGAAEPPPMPPPAAGMSTAAGASAGGGSSGQAGTGEAWDWGKSQAAAGVGGGGARPVPDALV